MDDALTVLRREFEASEGSFLLGLRGSGLVWERAAFSRLERAMRVVCKQYEDCDDVPRWMAEGFYYVAHFVAEWTSHPNFPGRSGAVLRGMPGAAARPGGLVLPRVALLPGAARVA
ncbi:hypothetical protein [Paractinoplanes durhamensis]|uniref:hypothetical protein n=1 Tax=Paractinoplanes durhamensis TaxID=113563 RepID=UPI00363F3BDE